ncbi:MAG: peptidylprolyl isomerase [Proteobacteria bacterium]|nr:peptidylprolyl isomerase [Pseudomonadota bacterium]
MRRYSRKKNSIRIFSAVTLIAALIFAASYSFFNKKDKGDVIARVNGQEIFQSEIEQKLISIFDGQDGEVKVPEIANLSKEILDVLIKETYLDKELSKLAKHSKVIEDKDVKGRIAESENRILRQSYIKMMVASEVTEQKISEKYAEISSNLAGKKEYLVFNIIAKSKEEAEKIRNQITAKKKSIKFSDAAKKYSLDQESAERGGELGFIIEDGMIKEISDVVVNLKKDEISAPIQTKFGWHLVKFVDVREAQALPFDSVKKNIREQLEQDKTSEIEEKIVKDAKVEILIKLKEEEKSKVEIGSEPALSPESATITPEVALEKIPEEEVKLEQNSEEQIEQKSEKEESKSDKKHRR